MNFNEVCAYFLKHDEGTYDRENYDKFLKKEKISFSFKSIHITGTNGKGTVSAFLQSIYKAKGLKVGLYNSPFLDSPLEMIVGEDSLISEDEFVDLFNELLPLFERYNLTSFEIQTIIAFTYFERKNYDLVIVEVGMGGFIDATNILDPLLSIITTVSLEHTNFLGRSVSEIAANKAGIIKFNKPALIGKLDDSALFAIKERCSFTRSKLFSISDFHNEHIENDHLVFDYLNYEKIELNTKAKYMIQNAVIAIDAVRILNEEINVSEETLRKGLFMNMLPCRFEFVKKNVLIDGAHNPEAINSLCESIEFANFHNIHIIFANFRDKNLDAILNKISTISNDITLTTFKHKRARTEMDYFLYLEDYPFIEDYKKLIDDKLLENPDDLILITGSLAFAAEVKRYLKAKDE